MSMDLAENTLASFIELMQKENTPQAKEIVKTLCSVQSRTQAVTKLHDSAQKPTTSTAATRAVKPSAKKNSAKAAKDRTTRRDSLHCLEEHSRHRHDHYLSVRDADSVLAAAAGPYASVRSRLPSWFQRLSDDGFCPLLLRRLHDVFNFCELDLSQLKEILGKSGLPLNRNLTKHDINEVVRAHLEDSVIQVLVGRRLHVDPDFRKGFFLFPSVTSSGRSSLSTKRPAFKTIEHGKLPGMRDSFSRLYPLLNDVIARCAAFEGSNCKLVDQVRMISQSENGYDRISRIFRFNYRWIYVLDAAISGCPLDTKNKIVRDFVDKIDILAKNMFRDVSEVRPDSTGSIKSSSRPGSSSPTGLPVPSLASNDEQGVHVDISAKPPSIGVETESEGGSIDEIEMQDANSSLLHSHSVVEDYATRANEYAEFVLNLYDDVADLETKSDLPNEQNLGNHDKQMSALKANTESPPSKLALGTPSVSSIPLPYGTPPEVSAGREGQSAENARRVPGERVSISVPTISTSVSTSSPTRPTAVAAIFTSNSCITPANSEHRNPGDAPLVNPALRAERDARLSADCDLAMAESNRLRRAFWMLVSDEATISFSAINICHLARTFSEVDNNLRFEISWNSHRTSCTANILFYAELYVATGPSEEHATWNVMREAYLPHDLNAVFGSLLAKFPAQVPSSGTIAADTSLPRNNLLSLLTAYCRNCAEKRRFVLDELFKIFDSFFSRYRSCSMVQVYDENTETYMVRIALSNLEGESNASELLTAFLGALKMIFSSTVIDNVFRPVLRLLKEQEEVMFLSECTTILDYDSPCQTANAHDLDSVADDIRKLCEDQSVSLASATQSTGENLAPTERVTKRRIDKRDKLPSCAAKRIKINVTSSELPSLEPEETATTQDQPVEKMGVKLCKEESADCAPNLPKFDDQCDKALAFSSESSIASLRDPLIPSVGCSSATALLPEHMNREDKIPELQALCRYILENPVNPFVQFLAHSRYLLSVLDRVWECQEAFDDLLSLLNGEGSAEKEANLKRFWINADETVATERQALVDSQGELKHLGYEPPSLWANAISKIRAHDLGTQTPILTAIFMGLKDWRLKKLLAISTPVPENALAVLTLCAHIDDHQGHPKTFNRKLRSLLIEFLR